MIELGSIAMLSLLGGAFTVPAVLITSRLQRWIGRRRNAKGLCRACRGKLYQGGAAPSRIQGVLFCPSCTEKVRRTMTASLWVGIGVGLLLPVAVGLGMAGLLPFVTGGVTLGAIAGLVVPPAVLSGAVAFELRQARQANALAEIEEEQAMSELGAGAV